MLLSVEHSTFMTLNKVVGMSEDLVGLQRHREFEYGIRFQPSFLQNSTWFSLFQNRKIRFPEALQKNSVLRLLFFSFFRKTEKVIRICLLILSTVLSIYQD